jgi:hypothetical protein
MTVQEYVADLYGEHPAEGAGYWSDPAVKRRLISAAREPGCACGERRTACLDFHHVDPTLKRFALYRALDSVWTVGDVEEELAKCIVICSNCHRCLHAKRGDTHGPT